MKRQKYYTDGVTAITDPFFVCQCQNGHSYWSMIYTPSCSVCGSKLASCIQADKKRATSGN